jgi:hypothetical protein
MPNPTIRLLAAIVFLLPSGCPPDKPSPQVEPGDEGPDLRFTSRDPSMGQALASGDFDADGTLDLAFSQAGATWVCSGPHQSDRSVEDCEAYLQGDSATSGDLDGDGIPELLTADALFEPVVHLYRQPLGQPEAHADLTVFFANMGPPLLAVADLHDKPGTELVVGAAGYDGFGLDEGAKLMFFEASALEGPLTSEEATLVIDAAFVAKTFYNLELGDTSGDGLPDMLTSFMGFNHANESYLFEAPLQAQGGELELSADITFDGGHAHFVGDLDGDGVPDLAVPAYESVRFWTGSLSGEPDATLAFSETPQNLLPQPAGDLDGDSVHDLLIVDPLLFKTWLFFGPVEGDAEPDLLFALREEILSFDRALVLPDMDDNGTNELLLGSAHDLYGNNTGLAWLVGLPWFEGFLPEL